MFTAPLMQLSPNLLLLAKRLIWTPLALALALIPMQSSGYQAGTLSDAAIATGVRQALATHPDLRDEQITVVVQDGIVELSGYVDSRHEQAVADSLAARLDGVRAVDNRIEPREPPPRLSVEPSSDLQAAPTSPASETPSAAEDPEAGAAPLPTHGGADD